MLPQRIAAMIASGITALNIALSGIVYPLTSYGTDAVIDPLHLYTDTYDQQYQEWLDLSEIKIDRNVIVIDGVSYDNVWLSNEAAEKFRVAAGDFQTAYNIASNSNGTYASGYGDSSGVPLYSINGNVRSPNYKLSWVPSSGYSNHYLIGDYDVNMYYNTGSPRRYANVTVNGGTSANTLIGGNNNDVLGYVNSSGRWVIDGVTVQRAGTVNYSPFDFDYTSGLIPVDPLPVDYGINYRVPSTIVNNVYNNYYGTDQTQWPDLSIPVTIDTDTTEGALLAVLIADLIADAIDALKDDTNITINYAPQPDTPIPDPRPEPAPDVDPDTPIDQITYNDYYQTITNQTQYINEGIENIDQGIQNIYNQQDQIINNQDTIIQESIPEIIENIPKIDDICNNIDTAPYHDLDTGLDRLPSFILPFITDLRSALGIWHYVTEWLSQVSTTFAFISGCLVGTSIMTPIYAAIAGFMCIKVYRRMTG